MTVRWTYLANIQYSSSLTSNVLFHCADAQPLRSQLPILHILVGEAVPRSSFLSPSYFRSTSDASCRPVRPQPLVALVVCVLAWEEELPNASGCRFNASSGHRRANSSSQTMVIHTPLVRPRGALQLSSGVPSVPGAGVSGGPPDASNCRFETGLSHRTASGPSHTMVIHKSLARNRPARLEAADCASRCLALV